MSAFTDFWSELALPGSPLPFMLIDCAGIEGGSARIPKHIFSELECLFAGTLAIELGDVAPYLGQIKSFSADTARLVEYLMIKQVGILVIPENDFSTSSSTAFSQMYRHFRKFNVAENPDGKKLFFRYYDPRVIFTVLNVFDASQLNEFYGPVTAFYITLKNGHTVRYTQTNGVLVKLELKNIN